MTPRVVLVVGLVAILSLIGLTSFLPAYVAFFVGSLAVILFPGILIASVLGAREAQDLSLPGRLAVWFAAGIACLAAFAFAGLMLRVRLSSLMYVLSGLYAILVAVLAIGKNLRDLVHHHLGGRSFRAKRAVYGALLAIALGAAFLTLFGPRNSDDWYYLAYIRDFTSDHALGAEDAVSGPTEAASPRIWYGAWWVTEALLSRIAGTDPVSTHQIYLPVLMMPFAVFALFLLSRQVFGSDETALLATSLQMLFLLSSAGPTTSAGWAFFARAAQDKTVCFAVLVPITIGLALRFINRAAAPGRLRAKGAYLLYCLTLLASTLVHPLGIAWCALGVIPFAVVESVRRRTRGSILVLALLLLPFVICGTYAAAGRGPVAEDLEAKKLPPVGGWETSSFFSFYLPGEGLYRPTYDPRAGSVLRPSENLWLTHPAFITGVPLALLGFALSFPLLIYAGRSRAARFLGAITFAVVPAAFVPGLSDLVARFITWKMVPRIPWILPWGLTLGFFMSRLRLRAAYKWGIVFVVALALARGDPRNYVKSLVARRAEGRPPAGIADVFKALDSEPAPQGVVLTTPVTGRMLAAYVADAYPAVYRGSGVMSRKARQTLLAERYLDESDLRTIQDMGCRYILIDRSQALDRALRQEPDGFDLIYANQTYSLWSVPTGD